MGNFRRLVQKFWFRWTAEERLTAKRALLNLTGGSVAKLNRVLPILSSRNARSAITNGEFMTDVVASWVNKGFVAGPFKSAPLENFRVNPLMAVVQRDKVRPILNLSAPKGGSFNEAVDSRPLYKLRMSSARQFGEAVMRMGKGAVMSKFDIRDAYKLIKNRRDQWRLFGFKWLGRYFFDTTMVFGSKVAPENFDSLPETLVNMACQESGLPKSRVFRQLDDVPAVAPAGSKKIERFGAAYKKFCGAVGVPLAPFCSIREKAFELSTSGTVLGIKFDTEKLAWSLPADKAEGIRRRIRKFRAMKSCNLREVQKVHGKLADFAQMCPFMKAFRYNLLELLRSFSGRQGERRLITAGVKADLEIWERAVVSTEGWIPIASQRGLPPLSSLEFHSDAAGAAFDWGSGQGVNTTVPGDRGVAVLGAGPGGKMLAVIRWPDSLVFEDVGGVTRFRGHRSGLLEMAGLFLPFICIPNEVKGRHVVIHVDNMEVVAAWERRVSKGDPELAVLVRALHIVEAFLECKVYVTHVKRCSTPEATLADHFSQASTITEDNRRAVRGWRVFSPKGVIFKWLANPGRNWSLGRELVEEITHTMFTR